MQYLLLIHSDETRFEAMGEDELAALYAEYGQFTADIQANGHYVAGAQLQPTSAATSVRVRNGETLVTDGPFAETKEQLGGYYLIEAKDVDEAIEIASRIPTARAGTIEVRPLVQRPAEVPA
jgi:hypothetical protein